jgi:hypothetical protein
VNVFCDKRSLDPYLALAMIAFAPTRPAIHRVIRWLRASYDVVRWQPDKVRRHPLVATDPSLTI